MKTTHLPSLALALLLPALASAAPNEGVMTYSGYLLNSAGSPETAAQSLTFTLYDAATAGNAVWTQTVVGVTPDAQGWFSVVLGATPAAFPPGEFLSQTWLGIKVGAEVEMAPRLKVGAAPHALSVDYSGISGCTAANQVLQWSGTAWACIATPIGGAIGPTGPTGPAGPTGPTGPPGVTAVYSFPTTAGFGSGSTMANAATVTFTLAATSKVLILADINLWGAAGAACSGYTRLNIDGADDDTTLSLITLPAVVGANNGGSIATSKLVASMAAGSHTVILKYANAVGFCSISMNPHLNVLVLQ